MKEVNALLELLTAPDSRVRVCALRGDAYLADNWNGETWNDET